ncbi:hypothetical protein ABZ353_04390 [Streptomyces niveus]|uniref:hypothetical protein n=1 Tax=Streptomyces niveus TaxID=193462 RepID=UPI0033DF5241
MTRVRLQYGAALGGLGIKAEPAQGGRADRGGGTLLQAAAVRRVVSVSKRAQDRKQPMRAGVADSLGRRPAVRRVLDHQFRQVSLGSRRGWITMAFAATGAVLHRSQPM